MMAWQKLAELGNWTKEEAYEAAAYVAVRGTEQLKYISNLRPLLIAAINSARATFTAGKSNPSVPDYPECSICRSCGWVTVPHLKTVRGGKWLGKHTQAVTCRCPLGLWIASRRQPHEQSTLVVYEMANPDWMDQIDRRHEETKEDHALDIAEGRAKPSPYHELIERSTKKGV